MPIMKIGLDERTHREFKVWCAGAGVSMSEQAAGIISRFCEVGGKVEVSRVREGEEPKLVAKVVNAAAPKLNTGFGLKIEAFTDPVEEPEFKIINGRKFPTPLLGTLRDSSVMCYVCGEYCRSTVPWSKNVSGKEFVCQACWRKAL